MCGWNLDSIRRNADTHQPKEIAPSKAAALRSGTATPTTPAVGSSSSGMEALEREVKNMKSMMAQQSRQMAYQGQAIADLVEEVKSLRARTD
jgi:hypothetical protein